MKRSRVCVRETRTCTRKQRIRDFRRNGYISRENNPGMIRDGVPLHSGWDNLPFVYLSVTSLTGPLPKCLVSHLSFPTLDPGPEVTGPLVGMTLCRWHVILLVVDFGSSGPCVQRNSGQQTLSVKTSPFRPSYRNYSLLLPVLSFTRREPAQTTEYGH